MRANRTDPAVVQNLLDGLRRSVTGKEGTGKRQHIAGEFFVAIAVKETADVDRSSAIHALKIAIKHSDCVGHRQLVTKSCKHLSQGFRASIVMFENVV